MIAEELQQPKKMPDITIEADSVNQSILRCFANATVPFEAYLNTHVAKPTLNEDELTQIFVEQLDILIRKANLPFGVKNQYRDIYKGSRGYSDFYFHPIEEGKSTASLFSVESKRLPSPTKKRGREYVVGLKKNGGIERYKIEKHGKGLPECGMLGFVETGTFNEWIELINVWIEDTSKSNPDWNISEKLQIKSTQLKYVYLDSIALRKTSTNLKIHHFLIQFDSSKRKTRPIDIN